MSNQSMKKYQRLMEKAKELFFIRGYKGVSVEEIARSAGISKMTVYKYFPSKQELFIKVIIHYIEGYINTLKEELNKLESSIDKIEFIFSYALQASGEFPVILYKDIAERPYVFEQISEYKKTAVFKIWEEILEEGIKIGEIRPFDLEFISSFLFDLSEIFKKPYYINNEKGIKWLMENLYDFLKYGLIGKKIK